MTFEQIVELVRSERHRQIAKWGNRRNLHAETWLRILVEEVGEIAKEIEDDRIGENISPEIIQVAAVCFAWLSNDETPEEVTSDQPATD